MGRACVFCSIVAGDEPCRRVAETDRSLAILDINPATDGHTLVLPKAHARDLLTLADADADDVWRLTGLVARRLHDRLSPEGLTLFQANGRAGWQDVFHFHLHVVPRWSGDPLVRPWEPSAGDPKRLDHIAARIRNDRVESG